MCTPSRRRSLRRYLVVRRSLVPDKVRTIDDYVGLMTANALSHISVPERFDKDKLAEVLVNKHKQRICSDKELVDALKKLETRSKRSTSLVDGLYDYVTFLCEHDKKHRERDSLINASMFLASDGISFTLFADIALSDNTVGAYLSALHLAIGRTKKMMNLPRARNEFRISDRRFQDLKRRLAPLIDAVDIAMFREYCLKLYLLLVNAATYEEALSPKTLTINNANPDEVRRLQLELQADLKIAREHLLQSEYSTSETKFLEEDLRRPMNAIAMAVALG
jgi:hypothetical protein